MNTENIAINIPVILFIHQSWRNLNLSLKILIIETNPSHQIAAPVDIPIINDSNDCILKLFLIPIEAYAKPKKIIVNGLDSVSIKVEMKSEK